MVVVAGGATPGIATTAGIISLIITVIIVVIVVSITLWVIKKFREAFTRPGYDRDRDRGGGFWSSTFGSSSDRYSDDRYRESKSRRVDRERAPTESASPRTGSRGGSR